MDHEPHLFDRLGDAGAVGVAAVAGIEEEHVEVALLHGVEQAAEVDAGILGRAAHGVDEFLFAFGLAALHRKESPARADEVVAQGLKRDDRPDALQPVGVAGEAAAHPDDGAGALGKRPVEGGDGVFGQPGGLRHLVDAPRLRALFHELEAGDALVHPRAVEGSVFKNEADRAEGERAVRAGQGHELVGGPSAGGRLAAVHAHDAHPRVAGLVKPAGVGRVGFADVRAPEHEGLRVDDLVDRGGGGVRAEQHAEHVGRRADADFTGGHDVDPARRTHGHERGEFAFAAIPQGGGEGKALGDLVAVLGAALAQLVHDDVHGLGVGDGFPFRALLEHGLHEAVGAVEQLDDGQALGAHGPAGPAVAAIADEFEDFAVAHARVVGAADLAERAVALHQIVLGSGRSGGSLSRMDRQTPEGRAPGDRRHAVLKEMSAGECVGHGCSVLGTPRATRGRSYTDPCCGRKSPDGATMRKVCKKKFNVL